MAANVLNNARAVHMSVYVVRAFTRLRERFQEVYRAIRALTDQRERKTRQIGFTAPSR